MRVLVTGALGKVGAATVACLHEAGHEIVAADRRPPVFEAERVPGIRYFQADFADAGDAYAAARGADAIVHAAALPAPLHSPPHVTFQNNLMGVFNTLEAAVALGAERFVNISSETVPGFFFNERPDRADVFPITEDHPRRPQDPYALAKDFGEQLCDAAMRRSDLRATSIRPSWVQWEGNYARNIGAGLHSEPGRSPSGWAYIDAYDLADAIRLALETDRDDHETFLIAAADNALGRPLAELLGPDDPPLGELDRPDASGTSIARARERLGYEPKRSWRDYLDPATGELLPQPAERLANGDTPIQWARAALS